MLYKQILTNDQIDELNNLLIDHSETISAFYDEGITYGLRKGCLIGFIGCSLGVLSGIIIDEIVKYKNHRNQRSSPNHGLFLLFSISRK